jgi:thiamine biosynthesis protein ThiS
VSAGLTLAALLEQLQVNRQHVAVELNRELVPREQHAERQLADGDVLEIVTLVGGG